MSPEEREANLALRFLAKSQSEISGVGEDEIKWTIKVADVPLVAFTRRYPSSDLGILFQVLGKFEYQPAVDILRKRSLNGTVRIVDAGANVGFASLYFKACFPDAEVISLEVDQSNCAQLRKNVEANKLSGVSLFENALWNRQANLVVKRDFRDRTECSFYVEEVEEETGLTGYDLGHYMRRAGWSGIDLLKIDIEGAERYLFETDALADNVLSKTNVLAIEIHDEFQIREDIYRHLARNAFEHFNSGDLTIAYRH